MNFVKKLLAVLVFFFIARSSVFVKIKNALLATYIIISEKLGRDLFEEEKSFYNFWLYKLGTL